MESKLINSATFVSFTFFQDDEFLDNQYPESQIYPKDQKTLLRIH